jgi:hypothetical protein
VGGRGGKLGYQRIEEEERQEQEGDEDGDEEDEEGEKAEYADSDGEKPPTGTKLGGIVIIGGLYFDVDSQSLDDVQLLFLRFLPRYHLQYSLSSRDASS